MIKHDPFSAHIWGKSGGCTANPMMTAIQPKTEPNEDAKEGLAAHELAHEINCAQARSPMFIPSKESKLGQMTNVGITITEEMYDSVRIFTDRVGDRMRSAHVFGGENLGFESKIPIHSISKFCNGKIDAYLYDRKNNTIYVWDFKFGKNPIAAYEFYQGIVYTKGLIDKFEIDGLTDQKTKVVIEIIQPRAYKKESSIDQWVVTASDLRAYFNILKSNAHESLHAPKTTTGPHCGYCRARHSCEAALKAGMKFYEVSSQPTPLNMTDEALSLQYSIVNRAIEMLKGLQSGYQEQIEIKLRQGKNIPGYGLEPSYSRIKWVKPYEQVKQLGDLLGHKLTKDELITPIQAINLGIDESVIKEYSDKVKTGVRLVKKDTSTAKRIFSQ